MQARALGQHLFSLYAARSSVVLSKQAWFNVIDSLMRLLVHQGRRGRGHDDATCWQFMNNFLSSMAFRVLVGVSCSEG